MRRVQSKLTTFEATQAGDVDEKHERRRNSLVARLFNVQEYYSNKLTLKQLLRLLVP